MNRKFWTDDEIFLLKINFSIKINEELIKLFPDRTFMSIKVKAKRLKLRKNKNIEFKNRSDVHQGKKNSMWGKISPKRGKKYNEYYGNNKSNEIRKKLRINAIKRISLNTNNNYQITPFYNKKACEYFNYLMKKIIVLLNMLKMGVNIILKNWDILLMDMMKKMALFMNGMKNNIFEKVIYAIRILLDKMKLLIY